MTESYFLTILEAAKSKMKVQQGLASAESSSWLTDAQLFNMSSYSLSSVHARGNRELFSDGH